MMKMCAVAVVALFAVGCGDSAPMAPSMTPTTSTSQTPATGTWTGSASDSSSGLGAGAMMGQSGMGTVTWQLSQTGSAVTGTMRASGMQGRMPGSFIGTMTGNDMSFTMDMPMNSMMSSDCSARATGTARLDPTTMTLTCTYSGTNSCSGPFGNGQMTMTRR
jgi:hypothetical protein